MSWTWKSMFHCEHVDGKNQRAQADERYNVGRRSSHVTDAGVRASLIAIARCKRRSRGADTSGLPSASRPERACNGQCIAVVA
jgi:hypothetical protein